MVVGVVIVGEEIPFADFNQISRDRLCNGVILVRAGDFDFNVQFRKQVAITPLASWKVPSHYSLTYHILAMVDHHCASTYDIWYLAALVTMCVICTYNAGSWSYMSDSMHFPSTFLVQNSKGKLC